jgi:zinc protease
MPNGAALRRAAQPVPPGQVAIRVRIDAGSLHERRSERGFAHLIEHLTFRESKYSATPRRFRTSSGSGASLGNDTNATPARPQTVYQLDLPNATPDARRQHPAVLGHDPRAGAERGNIAAEVPIVLAERRERNGPERRIASHRRGVLRRPAARRPQPDRHGRDAAGGDRGGQGVPSPLVPARETPW